MERAIEAIRHVQACLSWVIGIGRNLFRIRLVRDVVQPHRVRRAPSSTFVAAFFGSDDQDVARLPVLLSKDGEGTVAAL